MSGAWVLRGWGLPELVGVRLGRAAIPGLRAGIARDIAALLPRCAVLEAGLSERQRAHRGYAGSKHRHRFELELSPGICPAPGLGRPVDPPLLLRHAAAERVAGDVAGVLARAGRVVCVGAPAGLGMLDAIVLRPDGGDGGARPAADTLAGWLAVTCEAERAAIGAYVLTRHAGRAEAALLRHRVYPHQRVVVQAGSPALTWLLAEWGGTVVRHDDATVLSEPAAHFREPGQRFAFAPGAGWPRISVVTVSYNQVDYLEDCLRSVLDQRYPNLDYIVVDAGSTDGSVELLRRYEQHFSRLIVEPDRGQSDGLNKGFAHANGDILTWINSDDMLAPLALKRAALAMRATGADLVAGTCTRIAADGTVLYRHHAALPTGRRVAFGLDRPLDWCGSWEKGDWFFQPEVFFSRDIWRRAGAGLKLHMHWAMDWELWLRCALAGASIVRIPDILGISRVHDAQKTTSEEMYLWQLVGILREYDDLLAAIEAAPGVVG